MTSSSSSISTATRPEELRTAVEDEKPKHESLVNTSSSATLSFEGLKRRHSSSEPELIAFYKTPRPASEQISKTASSSSEASMQRVAGSSAASQPYKAEGRASQPKGTAETELEALRAFLGDDKLAVLRIERVEKALLDVGFGSEEQFRAAWGTREDWKELKEELLSRGMTPTEVKLLSKAVERKGWM